MRSVEIGERDIVNVDEDAWGKVRDHFQIDALRIRARFDGVTGIDEEQISRPELPKQAHRDGLTELAEMGDAFQASEALRGVWLDADQPRSPLPLLLVESHRSEERRVGKECRSRWSPYH